MRYACKSVDLYAPSDARIDLLGHRRVRNRVRADPGWILLRFQKIRIVGVAPVAVKHLRRNGFVATVVETTDLRAIKMRLGVPADFVSCHTAEIAGYIIEGHVPAQAVQHWFARPDALGLAVPGMPVGSPGMEGGAPRGSTT